MRSRIFSFVSLVAASSLLLPVIVHAAAIPFFGPIIDPSWTVPNTVSGGVVQCALGWGAVITVINNIIRLLITLGLFILVPIRIAIAGFNIVIHSDNPGTISKEGKVILNTVIGIVIALAAWLIVDAVMAVLTTGPSGTTFARNWSSIITSGNALNCLPQNGVGSGLSQSTNGAGVTVASGTNGGGSKLNIAAAVAWLSTNVTTTNDSGICLTDIEKAFSAGGLALSCPSCPETKASGTNSGCAGQCNGSLQALNFTSLGSSDPSPQPGDVVVVQHINPPPGGNTIGHIAMFTGSSWISDFVQSSGESPPGNPYPVNQFGGAQYWRP